MNSMFIYVVCYNLMFKTVKLAKKYKNIHVFVFFGKLNSFENNFISYHI